MTTDYSDLTPEKKRSAQAMLVALRLVEGLVEAGYVSAPQVLTDDGRAEADALLSDGFSLTDDEMRGLTAWMLKK